MFDGLFSYRYNMRLKSPCEIASDMTLWFSAFPNFRKNGQISGFHWTFKSKKCFSFRGRPPWLPDQGLCPWAPLGAPPPDPHYRLALCALAMPPLPNPKHATYDWHIENSKNHKKVILFNSTLTVRQCDGEWYHLFMIFAVFDVSVIACHC